MKIPLRACQLLLIVPAQVQGGWQLPQGELALEQKFQKLTGTLTAAGDEG